MDVMKEAALYLASLSVYQGIRKRTVPAAYYRLLCAYDAPPLEFATAWGTFYSLLCNRGYSGNLAGCLTEAALFDENAFSRAAAAGDAEKLPEPVLDAARRDIAAICRVASLTPEMILAGYRFRKELGEVATTLPRWKTGTPVQQFGGGADCLKRLADYHRKYGCGMFARYRAFLWREGRIEPVVHPDPVLLDGLKGYDLPRRTVVENTLAFLEGLPCNNCLLYGDRGTGKSSTVKAILNRYYTDGLRMVEMPKEHLSDFPKLVDQIAGLPLRFIIFIDDLSFSRQDDSFASLKAVLEGGLAARPENALIYATSNRRHLLRESFSDREGDEVHRSDSIQESLSLADRFGLCVNFSAPDRAGYLAIVQSLAGERGLQLDVEELSRGAEQWALERGGRSPRCAKQYVAVLEAKQRKNEMSGMGKEYKQ
jgi:predicted AAA+ superfamily ATPase